MTMAGKDTPPPRLRRRREGGGASALKHLAGCALMNGVRMSTHARPAVVSLFVREVMIFVISHGTICFLSLRQTCAPLRRRAGQGFALSLLRLPKADGIAVQRRRILSARKRCADGWRGEELPSSVSQRLRRFLPFLPRLRIVAMVGARTPSPSNRRGGRSLRRSGFPDASTGGVVRTAA